MTNVKVDLADLFRHVQSLSILSDKNTEKKMELDFYKSLLITFAESITPNFYQTIIPIKFEFCSINKAKELANKLGLNIVEGTSGTTYLSFAKGVDF